LLAKNTQNWEVFKTKQLCCSAKPRIVAKKIVTIQGEQLFYAGLKNAWFQVTGIALVLNPDEGHFVFSPAA
jgi:hypothetical protein